MELRTVSYQSFSCQTSPWAIPFIILLQVVVWLFCLLFHWPLWFWLVYGSVSVVAVGICILQLKKQAAHFLIEFNGEHWFLTQEKEQHTNKRQLIETLESSLLLWPVFIFRYQSIGGKSERQLIWCDVIGSAQFSSLIRLHREYLFNRKRRQRKLERAKLSDN